MGTASPRLFWLWVWRACSIALFICWISWTNPTDEKCELSRRFEFQQEQNVWVQEVHHLLIIKREIDRHGHFYGFVIVLDKILDHLKNIIMGTSNKKVGCSMWVAAVTASADISSSAVRIRTKNFTWNIPVMFSHYWKYFTVSPSHLSISWLCISGGLEIIHKGHWVSLSCSHPYHPPSWVHFWFVIVMFFRLPSCEYSFMISCSPVLITTTFYILPAILSLTPVWYVIVISNVLMRLQQ